MKINNIELIESEEKFELDQSIDLPNILSLSNLLDLQILKSPDSSNILKIDNEKDNNFKLSDGINNYVIRNGCPILYPQLVTGAWNTNSILQFKNYNEPLLKYVLLSQIKQSGEINAPLNSIAARKHQWRYKNFCSDLDGIVLDVGSDKPSHSIQFLPKDCNYIGLDPYAGAGEFRLIGLGEILPIADETVNVVTFNTSLDHILDYYTAINEAHRVLTSGGSIVIASYVWIENATLLTDAVHFHHFRENQLLAALDGLFKTQKIKKYEDPKHSKHRYGIYIYATKL